MRKKLVFIILIFEAFVSAACGNVFKHEYYQGEIGKLQSVKEILARSDRDDSVSNYDEGVISDGGIDEKATDENYSYVIDDTEDEEKLSDEQVDEAICKTEEDVLEAEVLFKQQPNRDMDTIIEYFGYPDKIVVSASNIHIEDWIYPGGISIALYDEYYSTMGYYSGNPDEWHSHTESYFDIEIGTPVEDLILKADKVYNGVRGLIDVKKRICHDGQYSWVIYEGTRYKTTRCVTIFVVGPEDTVCDIYSGHAWIG